jgi:hypothetical protein
MQPTRRPALIVTAKNGIGNRLRPILGGLRLAALTGRDFYLDWMNYQLVGTLEDRIGAQDEMSHRRVVMPGDWSDYFEPSFRPPSRELLRASQICPGHTMSRGVTGDIHFNKKHRILTFDDEPIMDNIQPAHIGERQLKIVQEIIPYARMIRPVQRLARQIDAFCREHTVDCSTVGVHIRLNHPETCDVDPERYFDYIDVALASAGNVFLSTDSDIAEVILRQRYGKLLVTFPKTSRYRDEPVAMDEAIIDLMLLSRVGALVRHRVSTFSDAAWWLGGGAAYHHLVRHDSMVCGRPVPPAKRLALPLRGEDTACGAVRPREITLLGSVVMPVGCDCDLRRQTCMHRCACMHDAPIALAHDILNQIDPLTRLVITGCSAGCWLQGAGDVLRRVIKENRTLEIASSGAALQRNRLLRDALASRRVAVNLVTAGSWELHEAVWGSGSWDEYVRCLKEYSRILRDLPEGTGRVKASFPLTEITAPYLEGFLQTCLEAGVRELRLFKPVMHSASSSPPDGHRAEIVDEAVAVAIDFALAEGLTLEYPSPEGLHGAPTTSSLNVEVERVDDRRPELDGMIALVRGAEELAVGRDGAVFHLRDAGSPEYLGSLEYGLNTLYRQLGSVRAG